MQEYEIIKFDSEDLEINARISPNDNTVWLTQKEIAILFKTIVPNVNLHIKNILKEELDNSVVKESLITATDGKTYSVKPFNLDMII